MTIIMKYNTIQTIADIDKMKDLSSTLFEMKGTKDKYEFVNTILTVLKYKNHSRKDRRKIFDFIQRVTSYSRIQMKRLVADWKKTGWIRYVDVRARNLPQRKYEASDIALLIKTDISHKTPNGKSVHAILEREYGLFKNYEYKTISQISVAHIYNIRKYNAQYLTSESIKYTKTNSVNVPIGIRTKPLPYGKPGYIRIDSVHQGDMNGEKGIYHIHAIDEVTQGEYIQSVPAITDEYMVPFLLRMVESFPFHIINFHSDNGSEYINYRICEVLQRLSINQTKSRSRRSTDNALVEGKNGSVIRKHMGRNFIHKDNYIIINEFYDTYFNIYLNFHRVCLFPTEYVDKRGKIRKVYNIAMVPYEAFKALPDASQYLRDGVTFDILDKTAYAVSDNTFAESMMKAKVLLEKKLKKPLVLKK